jgi:hypothetical protein
MLKWRDLYEPPVDHVKMVNVEKAVFGLSIGILVNQMKKEGKDLE